MHAILNARSLFAAVSLSAAAVVLPGAGGEPPPAPRKAEPVPPITNSVGMKLVYVPPGEFLMGSPEGEPGRVDNEIQHPVKITKGFYLGATEVTQGQWKAVMGEGSSRSEFKGDDLPVENVSWNDAVSFCKKLSGKEAGGPDPGPGAAGPEPGRGGKKYRLPTEAEWEYACRAGTVTRFNLGDGEDALGAAGWIGKNSGDATHPVGLKKPNAWDLCDMHGNVMEWTQDRYSLFSPLKLRAVDPQGPLIGSARVLRGGDWSGSPAFCRSACRSPGRPVQYNRCIGFRVALDSKPPAPAGEPKKGPSEPRTPADLQAYEAAVTDGLALMDDMATVMEKVKDKDSLQAALPSIAALKARGEALRDRMASMKTPSKEIDEALGKKYEPQIKARAERFLKAMEGLSRIPEASEILKGLAP